MNVQSPPQVAMRWVMLVVIAFGTVAMTFNWFVMPPTFEGVAEAYSIDLPQLALLISAFVIGYGIMHIPAGLLAAKFGIRATLVAGLGLEGALTSLAGIVDDYPTLLITRVLAGVAASTYAGISIAAVSVWFKNHEHAIALGVVSASFSAGVAVGLYAWTPVVVGLGWRGALVLAGLVTLGAGLVVLLVYRTPNEIPNLRGVKFSGSANAAILRNRILWRYGLALFGGYGAYFAASQLIGLYAATDRGFSEGVAMTAGLLVGIAGIPGSITAGILADRLLSVRVTFLLFLAIQGLGILLLPVAGPDTLWLSAVAIGFSFNGCFAVWQTAPGNDHSIPPELIGTAVGLLLTITAVGGFVVPWLFGEVAASAGYATAWIVIGLLTLAFGVFVFGKGMTKRDGEGWRRGTVRVG